MIRKAAGRETLSVEDNRTGARYELSVRGGAVRAAELRRIGVLSYDPAFVHTAACRSRITLIDEAGSTLRYRGYPVDQLAQRRSYLDVAWLLLQGELPSPDRSRAWAAEVAGHRGAGEVALRVLDAFPTGGSPLAMLVSGVAALCAHRPSPGAAAGPGVRREEAARLLAGMAVMGAYAYRVSRGLPPVPPDDDPGHASAFLRMVFGPGASGGGPEAGALETLFILQADHEQNCSTTVMRSTGSSGADPYLCVAAALAALSGPLHGAGAMRVLAMLQAIGSPARVPAYLRQVEAGTAPLAGWGHSVYTGTDPRSATARRVLQELADGGAESGVAEVTWALERAALESGFVADHGLRPSMEFYSAVAYHRMGFPPEMFPVVFAVARTAGWLAHWEEMVNDPEHGMVRPRQIYSGVGPREVP